VTSPNDYAIVVNAEIDSVRPGGVSVKWHGGCQGTYLRGADAAAAVYVLRAQYVRVCKCTTFGPICAVFHITDDNVGFTIETEETQ